MNAWAVSAVVLAIVAPQISVATSRPLDLLMLCPSAVGLCSWSDSSGSWRVVWSADEAVERPALSVDHVGGWTIVQQASPVGGKLYVFGVDGELKSALFQAYPLTLRSSVGGDVRSVIMCSGELRDALRCSFETSNGEVERIPVLPRGCLFPRRVGQLTFCVDATANVMEGKEVSARLPVAIMHGSFDAEFSERHELMLPMKSVEDFLPLSAERALLLDRDGDGFMVEHGARVTKLTVGGVTRLARAGATIFALVNPSDGHPGAVWTLGDGGATAQVWTGPEMPAEIAAGDHGRIYLRTEDPVTGTGALLEIRMAGVRPSLRTLWRSRR